MGGASIMDIISYIKSKRAFKKAESVQSELYKSITPGNQLFDKDSAHVGYYIDANIGELVSTGSSYTTSDYISVKGDTFYSFVDTSDNRVAYYDADKNFLFAEKLVTSPITTPSEAEYIRFNFRHNEVIAEVMQFEEGQELGDYEPYGASYLNQNVIIENVAKTHLSGTKMVCFGDSLTGSYSSPTDYPTYISNRLGATVHNVGFPGARMSTTNSLADYDAFSMVQLANAIEANDWTLQDVEQNWSDSYPEKLATLKSIDFNEVDIVTVFYGANDFSSNVVELDNENDDLDVTTLLGGARYAIKILLELYPHLKVVLLSNTWRTVDEGFADDTPNPQGVYLIEYVEGLESVANEFHIPFINMYNGLSINQYNYSTYLGDGLHPNPEGRKHFGNRISSQLLVNI